MLTNPSWVDAGKSHLVLLEDDECSRVFAEFLRFITVKCEFQEHIINYVNRVQSFTVLH